MTFFFLTIQWSIRLEQMLSTSICSLKSAPTTTATGAFKLTCRMTDINCCFSTVCVHLLFKSSAVLIRARDMLAVTEILCIELWLKHSVREKRIILIVEEGFFFIPVYRKCYNNINFVSAFVPGDSRGWLIGRFWSMSKKTLFVQEQSLIRLHSCPKMMKC